ncbi:MAG: glycosyltransferase family 2 protein [Bacteroidales bacterium]|nr:glycosyltransferase family 2 protein [Bacteroidales bacterium]
MGSFLDIFTLVADSLFLFYSVLIIGSYMVLWLVAGFILNRYMKEYKTTDHHKIINSPLAPEISLIAPCYNEGRSIVANIRALLNLHYNNYEVIVVNDGSTDNSLSEAIKAYELEQVHYFINERLKTRQIRGIYRSRNGAYHNLTVIDKENGGKADALNAGLNASNNPYVVCLDVDSIIEHDALLKLAYPFMKSHKKRLIAAGGVVHVANSCKIEEGRMILRRVPRKFLPRIQVVEYARAFLIGRMAWSRLNGLLLVSGAVGMFDREIVIESGGYLTSTVGEDMELVVRMRRHMYEKKIKHKVVYLPDPLLWTEVPADRSTLGRQRNRWTRGTMDTLFIHKKIFFNPRYGSMGLLGYPYWFFFEWLAPIVEVLGLIYFGVMAMLGAIHWPVFLILLIFIYLFAVTFSFFSILFNDLVFPSYERTGENLSLFLAAMAEPFVYHPLVAYWSIRGNISYLRGSSSWGVMTRSGFGESE